jgi:hypothetical protein
LTEAFAKLSRVPLALITSDENPNNDNFLHIYIEMTGKFLTFYHLLFKIKKMIGNVDSDLANADVRLLIKLPIHPSTIEELALIRFWLLKVSQTHFEELDANHGILNPEFLSVISPRTGPMKILFHANYIKYFFII